MAGSIPAASAIIEGYIMSDFETNEAKSVAQKGNIEGDKVELVAVLETKWAVKNTGPYAFVYSRFDTEEAALSYIEKQAKIRELYAQIDVLNGWNVEAMNAVDVEEDAYGEGYFTSDLRDGD